MSRITSPGAPTQASNESSLHAIDVEAQTRAWLSRVVIGLNLCPFAKAPNSKGLIRFVVTDAKDEESLRLVLLDELALLAGTEPERTETTLLIHPEVLGEFSAYNDFLDVADACVESLALEGVLQVASFHPEYCFAGNAPDDVENATNRSPYPTLHLLREESVSRAVAAFPEAETLYEANIETMRRLGNAGWAALRQSCRQDAQTAVSVPTSTPR